MRSALGCKREDNAMARMAAKIRKLSFDGFKSEGLFVLCFGAVAMVVTFILG